MAFTSALALLPAAETDAAPAWLDEADRLGWAWARLAWQRAAAVPGAWFDDQKAERTVRLWPRLFQHTEDRWYGKPFYLAFWQEIIVRLLVGWKRPVEQRDPQTGRPVTIWVRIFRELRLWVPRKAGKTEFLAALALLFWIVEGVSGGAGFNFARDEKQARILLDKMKAMLALHPRLREPENVQHLAKALWAPEKRSSWTLLSGKPEGKHGRSPTVIVGDEMHEWVTRELADTLRQGTGARLQPIELYASTAGVKTARVGYELFEESQAVLDGRLDDPSVLVVMFALGDDDDWTDEANIAKVNPNIGETPTWDFIRRELAKAKARPSEAAKFRRYHVNQWIDAIDKAIPMAKWDACCSDRSAWRHRVEALKGRRCTIGWDLSNRNDLTALAAWFEPAAPGLPVQLIVKFWCPESSIEKRSRQDRVSYDAWQAAGALTATPGDMVDQGYVQQAVVDWLAWFDVGCIGFDSWNATKIVTDLQEEGVEASRFLEVRQGYKTLSEPYRKLEELIFTSKLDHGGHPVLRWNAGNVVLRPDRNGNVIPDKARSAEKIDGIAATLTAYAASLSRGPREYLISDQAILAREILF